MGDSFYEYLLKVWIQGNKTEHVKHYRQMWETSMEGLISLTKKTTPSNYHYICEKNGGSLSDKMDELACFAPGMLALGASGYGPEKSEQIMNLAKELARTCYNFYQTTPTKLAGENYFFHAGQDMSVGTSWNILRPETVESLMYLWRLTGNKTYQDWGWDIFQAFEKNSRIESGYVGLRDVNTGEKDNMMQSFFLAETLKYLYLLFSPPSVISFDEWVFNTEAHPLRIVPIHDNKGIGTPARPFGPLGATAAGAGWWSGERTYGEVPRAGRRGIGRGPLACGDLDPRKRTGPSSAFARLPPPPHRAPLPPVPPRLSPPPRVAPRSHPNCSGPISADLLRVVRLRPYLRPLRTAPQSSSPPDPGRPRGTPTTLNCSA